MYNSFFKYKYIYIYNLTTLNLFIYSNEMNIVTALKLMPIYI